MFKAMKLLKAFHKLPEEQRAVVFFSEGANYWNTFKPVIDVLRSRGEPFVYLSMAEDDPGLRIEADRVSAFCIGKGSGFIYFMSMLKAGLVVMTTPGLQTLTLKRSAGVKHYAHLVHSPTGVSFYRRYSFDHFDTVLCSGPHQIEEIRKLEALRGTKPKNLLETGLPYMDTLKKMQTAKKESNTAGSASPIGAKTVLLAPTWGPNGAFSRCGTAIIESLAASGCNIIARPHPQQLRSEAPLLARLKKATAKIPRIRWDENPSGHESMAASDIMISDLSGIIFDYAFVYEKPVITMDYDFTIDGFEQQDMDGPVWEHKMSRALGGMVSDDNLGSLPETIENLFSRSDLKGEMRRLRENSLFHYGSAGETAARQILNIRDIAGN